MTNGNILKSITKFAIPCIISRIIQNLYPLIDSLIVGKILSLDSLAAVGLAGSVYSLFNDTLIGLVSGFAIIVGKKYGAKNEKEVKGVFANSLTASVVLCLILSVLGILFSKQLLVLLQTPESLIGIGCIYLNVIFLGLLPNTVYNFISEMLRALGDSKKPLYLLIISSVLHLLLIIPLTKTWGVYGSGLANVFSYLITIIIGFVMIFKKVPLFKFTLPDLMPKTAVLKECFSIGIPMALTNFVVMAGVLILSFITNKIGVDYVAAYSTASKIGYIITTPIFGFATAVSVFTSQNFGAKNYGRIKEGIHKTLLLVTIINVMLFSLSYLLSGPILNSFLDQNETAVNAGRLYLLIRCTAMFILTPAAFYKSVLPAIGKPFFSTLSGFLEIGVRYAFPLLTAEALGFISVPLTDAVTWLMLAAILTAAFYYEFKKTKAKT